MIWAPPSTIRLPIFSSPSCARRTLKIDQAVRVERDVQNLHPGLDQRQLPFRIRLFSRCDPRHLAMVLQDLGIRGESQPAVDNDGPRAVSVDMPDREQGIVRQNRADAHQDAVVDRPQLVGEDHGLPAAQGQRSSRPAGNRPVYALGIAQGHIGPARAAGGDACARESWMAPRRLQVDSMKTRSFSGGAAAD